MTTVAEAAAEIRKTLKNVLGFSSKDVSVRSRSYSMGSSIDIEARTRTAAARLHEIREIAEKHERIDRCEASGEILSGCNRYVMIGIDYDLVCEVEKEIQPALEAALRLAKQSPSSYYPIGDTIAMVAMLPGGSLSISTLISDAEGYGTCRTAGGIHDAASIVARIVLRRCLDR